jgi:RNA polymerase sigma-70 factor, ECF subfamily
VYEDVTVMVDNDFEALYRSVFARLVSLGAARTGRIDVARDLAQETLIRANDRWDELSRYDSPEAWCRTVMVNLLIDYHRSAQSEKRAVQRLAERPEALSSTPSLDRWRALIEPLPDRQQLVVTLYYADDLSVAEVARLLSTTRGAIKASLFKARRSLRKHLEENADG